MLNDHISYISLDEIIKSHPYEACLDSGESAVGNGSRFSAKHVLEEFFKKKHGVE